MLFTMPDLRHLREQCSLQRTSQTMCAMPQSCLLKPTIARPDSLPVLSNIAQFPSQQKVGKKKGQTLRSCRYICCRGPLERKPARLWESHLVLL